MDGFTAERVNHCLLLMISNYPALETGILIAIRPVIITIAIISRKLKQIN
jgi:hypothetical protein